MFAKSLRDIDPAIVIKTNLGLTLVDGEFMRDAVVGCRTIEKIKLGIDCMTDRFQAAIAFGTAGDSVRRIRKLSTVSPHTAKVPANSDASPGVTSKKRIGSPGGM